jgi:hypothetical protein
MTLPFAFVVVAALVLRSDVDKPVDPRVWGRDTVGSCCDGRYQVNKVSNDHFVFRDGIKREVLHTQVESYGYEGDDYVVRGGGKTVRVSNCKVFISYD